VREESLIASEKRKIQERIPSGIILSMARALARGQHTHRNMEYNI
jgi:hypothetical protein